MIVSYSVVGKKVCTLGRRLVRSWENKKFSSRIFPSEGNTLEKARKIVQL
jgi:hypothetical protein